ncbi:MAG: MarR family transcriptional regulator [Anaerolineae bacterium]
MDKKPDTLYIDTWRLFITANARLLDTIDAEMVGAGVLPLHWYDVLVELAQAPDHRVRMSDLAQRVILSKSGLTRLVDRLEAEQLLERERSAEDRRGAYAVLTDKGLEAMRRSWKVYAQAIQERFAAHLSDEEARILSAVFQRMLNAL